MGGGSALRNGSQLATELWVLAWEQLKAKFSEQSDQLEHRGGKMGK